jgi:putative ABC transport system permease protein
MTAARLGRGLGHDVRMAVRALTASRLVSGIAVATLALAIGANAAVFSLIDALLIRDLAVAHPEQLATVSSDFAVEQGFTAGAGWNYPMWENLRQRAAQNQTMFGGALAWFPQRLTRQTGGDAAPVDVLFVSGEYFSTLGVPALRGRTIASADDTYGGGPAGVVGVISYRLWQSAFAGNPAIVGTAMDIEGVPVTIIGVAPKAFAGLEVGRGFDVALPMGVEPIVRGKATTLRGSRSFLLLVMLRLREGQNIGTATQELRGVQSEIIPAGAPPFVKHPFTLVPAARGAANPGAPQRVYERPLVTMLAGVALVLIIACVNVANLQLARVTARRRELSVRLAVGASRWRLARPLIVEGLLLAVAGALGGFVVALLGARALVALTDATVDPQIDWRVAAFTAVVTMVTALMVSIAPALRATRAAPAEVLKAGGRGVASAGSARLSQGLAVFQIAIAVVVVTASGLLVRTFVALATRPLGFSADGVMLVNVETARVETDSAQRLQLFQRIADRVAGVAGVAGAAGSIWTPLTGRGMVIDMRAPDAPADAKPVNVVINFVTPGWFDAYRMPIRLGRDVGPQDVVGAAPVIVVNEAFVREVLQSRAGVGTVVGNNQTIVGIAGDAISRSTQRIPGVTSLALRESAPPTAYVPLAQASLWDRPPSTAIAITVRPAGTDAMALVPAIRRELATVDASLAFTFRPLQDDLDAALAQERVMAILSAAFGLISLVLGAIGLYGLMVYAVSLRTQEMGVRLALGAQPSGVLRLILGRALALVGLGTAIGLLAAAVLLRALAGMLFDVTPADPLTFAGVAMVLALVGTVATLLPARKASRVDPLAVLRSN